MPIIVIFLLLVIAMVTSGRAPLPAILTAGFIILGAVYPQIMLPLLGIMLVVSLVLWRWWSFAVRVGRVLHIVVMFTPTFLILWFIYDLVYTGIRVDMGHP